MGFLSRLFGLNACTDSISNFKRILIVRPDDIGDVVLFSPFLRGLRHSAPSSDITVIVNDTCSKLLLNCPYIDDVRALPFEGNSTKTYHEKLILHAKELLRSFHSRGFDAVLLPRADRDYYGAALVVRELAGAAKIFRSEARFVKIKNTQKGEIEFANRVITIKKPQSEVCSNLEFLRAIGGEDAGDHLEFWNSQEDDEAVNKWLTNTKIIKPFLVFHPLGSRSRLRRWPKGRCREFVEKILLTTEFTVVVVGGAIDEFVKDEFINFHDPRFFFCLNQFTLPQLGPLIKKSGFFVGGDSGPMHIAAAVGAKTIGIFGPGSQLRFGPHSGNSQVVSLKLDCTPDQRRSYEASCHKCIHQANLCLSKLEVETVVKHVRSWQSG